ncbi:hypothetical protein H1R20_g14026, partial [Candolleomyces eurysporus]
MSDFGDSDLSELESSNGGDDDDYVASSAKIKAAEKKKAAAKAAQAGFSITGALKPPRPTTYTTQALYDGIHHSHINLDADYQRDVVWNDVKQSNLIGSIFQNYYVPPIIFAAQPLDDGSEIKVCIDGKQRLTSIRRFMDGLIPREFVPSPPAQVPDTKVGARIDKDPTTGERWYFKDVPNGKKSRKILPDKFKRVWFDKQIVCVEYQDITDENEREIFQRVQLGMALTPAERMQGHNTPRCRFVRHLVFKHITEGLLAPGTSPTTNLPIGLDWAFARGADFRCIASVVFYLDKEGKKIPDGSSLEPWLRDAKAELDPKLKKNIEDAFDKFEELVQSDKLNPIFKLQLRTPSSSRSKPKVSPVEFVGIALLICAHQDKMSLKQLAACIGRMRRELHRDHLDLRLNGRVLTDVGRVIRECETDADIVADDDDDEDELALGGDKKGKKESTTTTKRKRKAVEEASGDEDNGDDHDDYASTKKKGKPKAAKKKQKPTPSSTSTPASASSSKPPSTSSSKSKPPPPPTIPPLPTHPNSTSSRITALKQARSALPSFTKTHPTGSSSIGGGGSGSGGWGQGGSSWNVTQAQGGSTGHLPTPPPITPRTHSVQQAQMQGHNVPLPSRPYR